MSSPTCTILAINRCGECPPLYGLPGVSSVRHIAMGRSPLEENPLFELLRPGTASVFCDFPVRVRALVPALQDLPSFRSCGREATPAHASIPRTEPQCAWPLIGRPGGTLPELPRRERVRHLAIMPPDTARGKQTYSFRSTYGRFPTHSQGLGPMASGGTGGGSGSRPKSAWQDAPAWSMGSRQEWQIVPCK